MQQQQQQQGVPAQFSSSPPPDMSTFASPGLDHHSHQKLAEAASPISSRPPHPPLPRQNFDELIPAAAAGHFADEDMEAERSGTPGNRWPRQETLALLKIRSEMDAAFRDASLKGPLWDDVSRKLGELGYTRSAKKCKEKFENVHKYYKRTKEGRAGRQDGKTYRFFTQLEALHTGTGAGSGGVTTAPSLTTAMPHPITTSISTAMIPAAASPVPSPTTPIGTTTTTTTSMPSLARAIQPPTATVLAPFPIARPPPTTVMSTIATPVAAAAGISFSSDTFTTSSSESDGVETEEGGGSKDGRKRKRDEGTDPGGSSSGGNLKMMAFFEGLMKQVMERQEAMQQRFLETIEKREQDRMIREEAWKCQEMARLNREHELLAQERAMAASRDTAVISFLQKISGQTLQLPPATAIPAPPPPPAPPATQQQKQQHTQQPQQPPPKHQQTKPPAPAPAPAPAPPSPKPPHDLHLHHQSTEIIVPNPLPSSSSTELVPVPEPHEVVPGSGPSYEGASSSRWPKPEVHALIKIRSGLEEKYQEAGPKGPLWEEISAEMQRLGYNRSSKRCKEKWENINKYFKKVKESNKKRPEDAKTCPYFHQLDALYRKKLLGRGGGGSGGTSSGLVHGDSAPNPTPSDLLMSMALPQAPPPPQHHPEMESKNVNKDNGIGGGSGGIQIQTSNGGLPPSFFKEPVTSGGGGGGNNTMKKSEGTVMEPPARQQAAADMDDYDSENMDDDDEDDDDDEEDMKMQYKIQYQRQNVSDGTGGNASANKSAGPGNPGSFLAMVQ